MQNNISSLIKRFLNVDQAHRIRYTMPD